MTKQVEMIALRDFPCTNSSGQGVTRRRKDEIFTVLDGAQKSLIATGKAKLKTSTKGTSK